MYCYLFVSQGSKVASSVRVGAFIWLNIKISLSGQYGALSWSRISRKLYFSFNFKTYLFIHNVFEISLFFFAIYLGNKIIFFYALLMTLKNAHHIWFVLTVEAFLGLLVGTMNPQGLLGYLRFCKLCKSHSKVCPSTLLLCYAVGYWMSERSCFDLWILQWGRSCPCNCFKINWLDVVQRRDFGFPFLAFGLEVWPDVHCQPSNVI